MSVALATMPSGHYRWGDAYRVVENGKPTDTTVYVRYENARLYVERFGPETWKDRTEAPPFGVRKALEVARLLAAKYPKAVYLQGERMTGASANTAARFVSVRLDRLRKSSSGGGGDVEVSGYDRGGVSVSSYTRKKPS